MTDDRETTPAPQDEHIDRRTFLGSTAVIGLAAVGFESSGSPAVAAESQQALLQAEGDVSFITPTPPDDSFARGDIIPIVLDFENTEVATLTFGDRAGNQNFEMNVTVRDVDGDGEALVYLNTFQIGDGRYVTGGDSGGFYDETLAEAGYDTDEIDGIKHGFQAGPGTRLEAPANYDSNGVGDIVDVYDPAHDIRGGSAGGAVIAGGITYDLIVTATELPHKEEGTNPTDITATRIEGRDGGVDLNLWTAPGSGSTRIEPETAEEIEDLAGEGIVTPADGVIADNDMLVFQLQSAGLEGVIYDSLLRTDTLSNTTMHELVDRGARGGDDLITQEFFASDLLALHLEDPAGDSLVIEQNTAESVVVEKEGGNFRQYYVPVTFESGTQFETANGTQRELRTGTEYSGRFSLTAPGGDEYNGPQSFTDGEEQASGSVEFQGDWTTVDAGGSDQIIVPAESEVNIRGTTNIAAGTGLLFTIMSGPGVEDPIFDVYRTYVEYQADAPNVWAFTTSAFDNDALDNTEFQIDAARSRDGEQLMRVDGEQRAFPGVISPPPSTSSVETLLVNDQPLAGEPSQTVVVAEARFSDPGVIAIISDDGSILGRSGELDGGVTHRNIPIELEETLESTTEVEVVAFRDIEQGQTFAAGPTRRSATLQIAGSTPAGFEVSNLDPTSILVVEPGETPPEMAISAQVTNTGESEITQDIRLEISDSVIQTQTVTLSGGANVDVVFTLDTSALAGLEQGEYTHRIASENDAETGKLTIGEQTTFEITDFTPEETTAAPGDEVTVTATIENTATVEATETGVLEATGDLGELRSKEIRLAAGQSAPVEITFSVPEVDEETTETLSFAIADDVANGTLTIQPPVTNPSDGGASDPSNGDDTDSSSEGSDNVGDANTSPGAAGGGDEGLSTETILLVGGGGVCTLLGAYGLHQRRTDSDPPTSSTASGTETDSKATSADPNVDESQSLSIEGSDEPGQSRPTWRYPGQSFSAGAPEDESSQSQGTTPNVLGERAVADSNDVQPSIKELGAAVIDPDTQSTTALETLSELGDSTPDCPEVAEALHVVIPKRYDDKVDAAETLCAVATDHPEVLHAAVVRLSNRLDSDVIYVRRNAAEKLRAVAAEYPQAIEPALDQLQSAVKTEREDIASTAAEALAHARHTLQSESLEEFLIKHAPDATSKVPQSNSPRVPSLQRQHAALESLTEKTRRDELVTYRGYHSGAGTKVTVHALATGADEKIQETFTGVVSGWYNGNSHPNVATIHDRGRDPIPWVAIDALDGCWSAADLPKREPQITVSVLVDAAEAIRNVGLYNTSHHNLAPAHIWVEQTTDGDRGVVDDWGLQRAIREAHGDTYVTPYTAPEQVSDTYKQLKGSVDVYGLGAVTYYALTGDLPVPADKDAICAGEITPPSEMSDSPPALDNPVIRALQTNPEDRFDSAYDFGRALERALSD